MKFNPKVSIIIPVYNGSNYLKEAIDSALAQTYKNTEIIVVNDGSNDKGATEKIAKSYGKKIRYFNKENGGVATALNFGIEKMTGEYFSWLSHDDMYVPSRTARMIRKIGYEKDGDKPIIASSFRYFNEYTEYSPERTKKYSPSHPLSYLFLGYINGCSMLIPKSIFLEDGYFNVNYPTTQDFELWFRLLRKNKLVYMDDELTLSRSHEQQGSKALLADHIKECDELWLSMMNSLSPVEKSNIFNDEYNFYSAIYDFLKNNTLYGEATYYAKRKMFEITRQKMINEGYRPAFIENFNLNIKKNKKTILFPIFGHYSDRAGLNKMIATVANQLSGDYNVIVASFTAKDNGYYLNSDVSYIYVSPKYFGVECFEDLSILFDVDIVVVSHNCCKLGLDLISKIKAINKKVIAWNHEDYFLPYINPNYCEVWSLRNDVLKKADVVLWLTNASCAVYSLKAKNGYVIPNFIHSENVRKKEQTEKSVHNNILAIARFDDPRKRINKLLECYEKIVRSRQDIELTILGGVDSNMIYKDNENIGEAIKRINTQGGQIKVVGFVKDVEKYYLKSDIHILPSYCEGFGLTILEAAFYGVPTAVFDNSGFDDIIDDGKNGIIAPEADTDILASRVIELFNNSKKLVAMKKSSREIVKRFDEKKLIKEWQSLIENVLCNKKINFNRYSYDKEVIQKISDGYINSLTEFSNIFVPYYRYSENSIESYNRILISRTWKYTQKLRAAVALARKIRARLLG